jgi:hypothetical protein
MGKGEQRGNREAKKPKKEKPKVIAAAPSMKSLMLGSSLARNSRITSTTRSEPLPATELRQDHDVRPKSAGFARVPALVIANIPIFHK